MDPTSVIESVVKSLSYILNFNSSIQIYDLKVIYFTYIFIESSGFVYGAMGFVEKLIVGFVIILVQWLMPILSNENTTSVVFFKHVLVFGYGGIIVFSLFIMVALLSIKNGQRNSG